jgi:hypothetical protein
MADVHRGTPKRPDPYPAEKARQGEIILKEPWQRAVFIVGLVGFGLVAIAFIFLR